MLPSGIYRYGVEPHPLQRTLGVRVVEPVAGQASESTVYRQADLGEYHGP
jgi:hypothetical protein